MKRNLLIPTCFLFLMNSVIQSSSNFLYRSDSDLILADAINAHHHAIKILEKTLLTIQNDEKRNKILKKIQEYQRAQTELELHRTIDVQSPHISRRQLVRIPELPEEIDNAQNSIQKMPTTSVDTVSVNGSLSGRKSPSFLQKFKSIFNKK